MSPKANVLVVDDSPSNRQMLKTCLNRAGYETVSADNGRKGLTLARRMPDVILLDVMMPEMDGIEMCQRLQDDPK